MHELSSLCWAKKYKSQVQFLLSGGCFLFSLFYYFHYLAHSESYRIKGRIFKTMLIFTGAGYPDPSALCNVRLNIPAASSSKEAVVFINASTVPTGATGGLTHKQL